MHFQMLFMMLVFSFHILSMDNRSFLFSHDQLNQGDSPLNQQEDSEQEKRKKHKVEVPAQKVEAPAQKKWNIDYETIYEGRIYVGKIINVVQHVKATPEKRTKKAKETVNGLEQKKN
ncbi:hypothetical protein HYX58_01990 [Candidatus Dependentiae bacterium]|nr:hypothetical protein [Candidatus Dependentiae bacterium]